MFFKKKKEGLTDQLAVYREREAPRYNSPAGIAIEGFEGEGKLSNISIHGCCLESITYVSITPNKEYRIKITPCPQDDLKPFSLNLVLNWTRSSEMLFQAGFSLKEGQTSSDMKRYVASLHDRGVKPNYGNMSGQEEPKGSLL